MTRRHLMLIAGVLGVLGAVALAIGFAIEPVQAAFSYLTAWAFAVSLATGALVFLMIGHAIAARWTIVFQRFTEALTGSLLALLVLFVPLALASGELYSWIHPVGLDPESAARMAHKAGYLNLTFWVIRTVVFFALWIAADELMARWSRSRVSDVRLRARAIGAVGLPMVGLTLTLGSFDWLMSLTPLWSSTIFGLLYWSGGFVGAMSLIAVIAWGARRQPVVADTIHGSHTGALGRMMFAFLVFWAYMEFAQGIIIWIANKPDEVPWYVARGAEAWGGVFALLIIGHFAAPFFALLSRPLKRRPNLLALVGGWIVIMHYVDIYWMVMPVLHKTLAIHWLDIAAPCGVLGLATLAALARPRARQVIADDDLRFTAAREYEGT